MIFAPETLKNNLQTLFVNLPGRQSGSVQIWFRAGSSVEKKGDEGVAHFLEHMFFKGTEKHPGAELAYEVESYGGEFNAFTSFDYTCYYINSPKDYMARSTELLMDMVANPTFKEEYFPAEREVVFEEFRRSQDNPNQYFFQKLQDLCFENGYDHPILGGEATIKTFNRGQITDFRGQNYNLSNALLIVAGDFEKENLKSVIEKFQLPDGPKTEFPQFRLKKTPKFGVYQKDVAMGQLYFCIEALDFDHKSSPAEDLALNCFGHGESSRLYKSLVMETSLANSVSSSTMFMANGGVHFIKLVFPMDKMKKVFQLFLTELKKILKSGPSDYELTKIKNLYLSSKLYELESVESFSFTLGHSFAQNGNIYSDEEFIKRAKKVELAAVTSSFQKVWTRPVHCGLMIPKEASKSDAEKTLKMFHQQLNQLKLKSKATKSGPRPKTSKFDPELKVFEIKNGVKFIYRQNEMTPTFTLQCFIKGGLTEEQKIYNGSYNIISSLLTQGHGKYSREKVKELLDFYSASLHGFAGKNAYGLNLHGKSEDFKLLVEHFQGQLLNPKMSAKDIASEKEMAKRTLQNFEQDPVRQCFQSFGKLIFPGHAYSKNLIGSNDSIKKINRKYLLELHQKNLKKKDLIIIYCGDLGPDTVLKELGPMLDSLPARKTTPKKFKAIRPAKTTETFLEFDREQTQIVIGMPGFRLGQKENNYLKILTTHLSGQSSELFVEVRDNQGLCYAVQPLHFTALEGGHWGIYIGCGHDKVDRAKKAIVEIIEKYKNKGMTEEEFQRAKKMIRGQSQLNIQTNEDYASIYSVATLHGLGHDFYYKNQEAIRDMTFEDFQTKINKILSQKFHTVTVGRNS